MVKERKTNGKDDDRRKRTIRVIAVKEGKRSYVATISIMTDN